MAEAPDGVHLFYNEFEVLAPDVMKVLEVVRVWGRLFDSSLKLGLASSSETLLVFDADRWGPSPRYPYRGLRGFFEPSATWRDPEGRVKLDAIGLSDLETYLKNLVSRLLDEEVEAL